MLSLRFCIPHRPRYFFYCCVIAKLLSLRYHITNSGSYFYCISLNIYSIFKINIVTHMTPARKRLGKHVPERYAVNHKGTSVAG
jgi:hypothetical protein